MTSNELSMHLLDTNDEEEEATRTHTCTWYKCAADKAWQNASATEKWKLFEEEKLLSHTVK